jgi:hypothetical protein
MEWTVLVGSEGLVEGGAIGCVDVEADGLLGEAWLRELWGVLAGLSVALCGTGGGVCATAKNTANKRGFMIQ